MLTIEPTGAVLGAVAHGIDLAQPLGERDMGAILLGLGRHGVLRFPDQHLGLGDHCDDFVNVDDRRIGPQHLRTRQTACSRVSTEILPFADRAAR